MKLLRLKLHTRFRSLQAGFEVHFLQEWDYDRATDFNPYILAGPNGSGKSNVLEALAAIFYHIECIYLRDKPENFDYDEELNPDGFQAQQAFPDAFELEYFIPVPALLNERNASGHAHVRIEKQIGKAPTFLWLNEEDFRPKKREMLIGLDAKQLLPAYILGYSSGENEILSLPFFKMRFLHFDEYRDKLIGELPYEKPEGRMVFLDTQFSQAMLLSNFLLQDLQVLTPFAQEVGLEHIREFRLIIGKFHDEGIDKELTSMLHDTIRKFDWCSTCQYPHTRTHEASGEEREYLILDYWVNDATKEAFAYHFNNSPLELFQAFQILMTLNLYHVSASTKQEFYQSNNLYVSENLPVPPPEDRIMRIEDVIIRKRGVEGRMSLKALSDGEHQFLHALGLCLLFKDGPCLFLLDEPETHFNPDWRTQVITRLRQCFQEDKDATTMREMLITTHAPYLISDSRKDYVLLFEKDRRTHEIHCSRPDFKTFGASINKITIQAFDQPETIGGFAQQKLDELEKRFEKEGDGDNIIREANRTLGESVEKILFVNRILDTQRKE